MKTKIPILLCLVLLSGGCMARFSTTQSDERTNKETGETTKITTKASAWTFNTAKSDLQRWKALQSEKQQGAEVGSLSQQSSSTNMTQALGHLEGILKALRPAP